MDRIDIARERSMMRSFVSLCVDPLLDFIFCIEIRFSLSSRGIVRLTVSYH